MGKRTWPAGTPSWIDVALPDVDKGKAFYSALFGWELEDEFHEGTRIYTSARRDGQDIAGMAWLSPEMAAGGMPPAWTTYIAVDDVEKTAARVGELGGTIVAPPMDVMEYGRMTAAIDPTGAAVAFWEARDHHGADLVNVPGTWGWNELLTRDTAGAEAFYTQLLGWTATTNEGGGMKYTEFALDGRSIAGMMETPPMAPPEMPAVWLVYFVVDDTDAAVAKITELGGRVVMPPMDLPVGRIALTADNQGATFYVIRLAGEPN